MALSNPISIFRFVDPHLHQIIFLDHLLPMTIFGVQRPVGFFSTMYHFMIRTTETALAEKVREIIGEREMRFFRRKIEGQQPTKRILEWLEAQHPDPFDPFDDANLRNGKDLPTSSSNWTINVPDIRTIKVGNVSPASSEREILEFFTFSGDIQFVEMQRESETSNCAYVTFKDSQGADTATLLTGATIAGVHVIISPVENYQLPPHAPPLTLELKSNENGSAIYKAEDVVSSMLAKGFVLGKDAVDKAIAFDGKHNLTQNVSATVASIDRKIGLSKKLSFGSTKVKEMDERFQVSEMTKSALTAAEQKATSAGSAIMNNRYIFTGASWVANAFSAVSKAVEDVSVMTKEKVVEKRGLDFTNDHQTPIMRMTSSDVSKLV